MRTVLAFLLAMAASFALLHEARANGGGFFNHPGWTGGFTPHGIEDLEMLSEDLEIRFGYASAAVEVTYRIRNEGPARKVRMGFPCTRLRLTEDEPHYFYWNEPLRLEDYRITADGEAVPSGYVEDDAPVPDRPVDPAYEKYATWVGGWHISDLEFAENSSREVSVSFRMPYTEQGSYVSDDEFVSRTTLSYILSSAAAWKGPIREGRVRLVVETPYPNEFSIRAPRDRFEKEGNVYTWSFTDLEPTAADDLAVSVYQPFRRYHRSSIENLGGDYVMRDQRYFFEHVRYDVSASSQLGDDGRISYEPENIREWDEAWVEGVAGDGIGESITIRPKTPLPVHHVIILPGYGYRTVDKTDKLEQAALWRANNRVAKLEVTVNGEVTFPVELPDSERPEAHSFFLQGYDKPVSEMVLKIAGVHRGEEFRDTALTRVKLVHELDEKPNVRGAR